MLDRGEEKEEGWAKQRRRPQKGRVYHGISKGPVKWWRGAHGTAGSGRGKEAPAQQQDQDSKRSFQTPDTTTNPQARHSRREQGQPRITVTSATTSTPTHKRRAGPGHTIAGRKQNGMRVGAVLRTREGATPPKGTHPCHPPRGRLQTSFDSGARTLALCAWSQLSTRAETAASGPGRTERPSATRNRRPCGWPNDQSPYLGTSVPCPDLTLVPLT